MNIERDKYLTEAMGECRHEGYGYFNFPEGVQVIECCTKCRNAGVTNILFSTWQGFGKLWEWCQTQEWWGSKSPFWAGYTSYPSHGQYLIGDGFVNPNRFADAVYAFLKEGKK